MEIHIEEDLNDLIRNEIEENTNLEYKDPRSLKNNKGIAKDISAMANSNGGVIIYGLCEEKKDHKPTKIDWMENHQQKERIEQILQANVTPKIEVIIKPIFNKEDSSKFVLKVEIEKSDIAPHQDHSDKDRRIYWRRNGFTTREMEHYEVEDLLFKRKRPVIQIRLKDISRGKDRPTFEIYLENIGKIVAEQTYIKLIIPKGCEIRNWEALASDLISSQYQHTLSDTLLYPKLPLIVGKILCPENSQFGALKINYILVCKDIEVNHGEIYINCEREMKINQNVPQSHPYLLSEREYIFQDSPFNSKKI